MLTTSHGILSTKEGKVPKKGACKQTPAKTTVSSVSCKPGNSNKESSCRILQLAMRSVFQGKGDNKPLLIFGFIQL